MQKVLRYACSPCELSDHITREIRELTGAQTVLMVQNLSESGGVHRVVSVDPEADRAIGESKWFRQLARRARTHDGTVICDPRRGNAPASAAHANKSLPEICVVAPLRMGESQVGTLVALGIPDEAHAALAARLLDAISMIAALVLRNSLLNDEQEKIIDTRTRQLKRERTLLANIAEMSPVGIVTANSGGRIDYANSRACEILGLTKSKISERTYSSPEWHITDLAGNPFPEDELPFARVMSTGKPAYEIRHAIEWPDGRRVLLSVNAAPMTDHSGKVVGMVAAIEDITQHEAMEAALKSAANEWQTTFEAISDCVWVMDRDFRIMQANSSTLSVLGISPGDVVGHKCHELVHHLEHPIDLCPGEQVLHSLQRESMELRIGERWLQITVNPVKDASGEISRMVHIMRDITEQKQAEHAALDRQAKLDSIFRAAPTGIGVVVDRVLTELNDRICEMTGRSREELLGHSARILYPTQEDYDYVGNAKYEQISQWGTGTVETRMIRKDGTIFDVLLSSTPIDPDDLSEGVTFTMLDITERRQADRDKRKFFHETILSVTAGRLNICDAQEVQDRIATAAIHTEVRQASDIRLARQKIADFCRQCGLTGDRLDGFIIAAGEALTNAVKHGNMGRAYAGSMEGKVWVGVQDDGNGIESLILPSAVLRKGFSTKCSLGLGYSIMLETVDEILLNTGNDGTTVVLTLNLVEPSDTPSLANIPDTWMNMSDISL